MLIIFDLVTGFAKNHFQTVDLTSNYTKKFLLAYFVKAVILTMIYGLVVDVDVPEFAPIFKGKFINFSEEWYTIVGSALVITMLAEIFAPHVSQFYKPLLNFCIQCWDRKCTKNERVTR